MKKYQYLSPTVIEYTRLRNLVGWWEVGENATGKALENALFSVAKSSAFVGLMAAKGLEKYYEQFGFKARDKDAPGMYLIIK